MSHIPHLINGERVAGNGRSAPVYNPSTGDSTSAVGLARLITGATIQERRYREAEAAAAYRAEEKRNPGRPGAGEGRSDG